MIVVIAKNDIIKIEKTYKKKELEKNYYIIKAKIQSAKITI